MSTLLLMFNLVFCFGLRLFFSKSANYLCFFFSFCSTICAFERVIEPFNLFSKILFNSFRLLSKFDCILSSNTESSELLKFLLNIFGVFYFIVKVLFLF